MNAYDLPTVLTVGGEKMEIRSGFRDAIKIMIASADPDLDDATKTMIMIKILYPQWHTIPAECMQEAAEKACEFLNCGQKNPKGKAQPRLVDWEKDAPLIVAAVNTTAGTEIRAIPNLHWWTFFSWFMEMRRSVYSNVLCIREQKAKGKKLDKTMETWCRQNRQLVDLPTRLTQEEQEFLKRMGGG